MSLQPMYRRIFFVVGAIAVVAAAIGGCATSNQEAPPQAVPTATPTTLAAPPPPPARALQPVTKAQEDWNIFPDPLTGRIEVYKNGQYVGAITGNETEDPPMPHKVGGSKTKAE